jgi:ArsR family transcriptional regulator, arsenate/arsenite/antimonite-responsive transcriptional repressor
MHRLDINIHFHDHGNMKAEQIVQALGALAQESRLAVFRLLVKRGPQGFTPGELAEKLTVPAPTLSFHLKELQHAQLVFSRREGRFLYYSANFETMNEVVNFLSENCCSLSDEACDAQCKPVAAPKRRRTA